MKNRPLPLTFTEKLACLDCILTGNSWEKVRTPYQMEMTPKKFFDDGIYYLSDAGYSRIYLDPVEIKLYLDSVSLEKSINRWKNYKELINDLEVMLNEYRKKVLNEV